MRICIILILSLFIGSIGLDAQDQLPSATITSLKGERADVTELAEKGKITIFTFWATWCVPCRKELDNISDLYEEWQENYNVELIAVSTDNARSAAKVKPLVNSKGWPYRIFIDTKQEFQQALNFQAVPYTIVVDQEGNIVYRHNKYSPGDEYELEELLKDLSEKGK